MTVSNQIVTIQISIAPVDEAHAQAIITAIATSIQTILTGHGVGGTLTVGGQFSETLAP